MQLIERRREALLLVVRGHDDREVDEGIDMQLLRRVTSTARVTTEDQAALRGIRPRDEHDAPSRSPSRPGTARRSFTAKTSIASAISSAVATATMPKRPSC